jgi:hypothetical protein
MPHSQTLKPEHRATPGEVKRAARDWCKYKAGVILKKHPQLNKGNLIAYLELQPSDSFSLDGFKTTETARSRRHKGSLCGMWFLTYGEYEVHSINQVLEQVAPSLFLTSKEALDMPEEEREISFITRSANWLDGYTFFPTEEKALAKASQMGARS